MPSGKAAAVEERYAIVEGKALMTGIQALARLPMDQRRADIVDGLSTAGFVTGYPGSPLAGYDVELGRQQHRLAELGIVHQPALNEELAATAVAGTQLASLQPGRTVDGVAALWYAKAPGLDRAGDAIRHGNLMGASARGGVLVCVGDDPQAKSSSVPSTSEPTLYGLGLPVLAPADPQDILDLGRHGFALSRASGLWVGFPIPASVADGLQSVQVGPQRVTPETPEVLVKGVPFVHRPTAQLLGATLMELERALYGPRFDVARQYAAVNALNRSTRLGRGDVLGVVASGPAYLSVLHAFGCLGLGENELGAAGVRLLKVAVPYPLDADLVRRFASGLREVVVVENKRGFLEMLVKEALYGRTGAPAVVGKRDQEGRELLPSTGEVDGDAVAPVLARRLLQYRQHPNVRRALADLDRRTATDPPLSLARGAYFCSGCPHNTGAKAPPGAFVGSGSGCHGLAIQMDPRQTGNVVGRFQMGGEGAMWNGMAPFVSGGHFFQNLGDGTFAHSGSQAIRASVASGADITYKLLVNSVVAMTGGQPIPGGRGIADLCRTLLAEGVTKIIVTTDNRRRPTYRHLPRGVQLWDRRRIVAAQEILSRCAGVTVLIHHQECALERQRRRRRRDKVVPEHRVYVNPLACDGCGDCGSKSNCVSVRPVRTALGPTTEIHQESCTLDYSCLDGDCPALLTLEVSADASLVRSAIQAEQLPEPAPVVPGDTFTVRITGIGGTGIVTMARIVATAAALRGFSVRGLDQTGIAQKGGSVCSDLRISRQPALEMHRLGAGECDLYLGCDLLVAAEPSHLAAASEDRAVAVVSTALVPTGRQVADRTIQAPTTGDLRARVERRVRSGAGVWIDAQALSRRRFGSDVYANILLLGAAYQRGALPIGSAAVEAAIRRNNVAVDTNIQAFRYGRLVVADPGAAGAGWRETVEPPDLTVGALGLVHLIGAPVGSELDRSVRLRVPDLVGYQDLAYARRYAEAVARCRAAEERQCGLADGPFANAVAVQLHRLMAYRDEYEVARLHRSRALRAELESRFGASVRVHYHLRPPVLRRLGLERKVTFGRGAAAAFAGLSSIRRLRGTAADPFGRAPIRRSERELRDDYEALVAGLSESLDPDGHARAVAIAGLPDMIRGYGPVKAAAIGRFRDHLAELERWTDDTVDGELSEIPVTIGRTGK